MIRKRSWDILLITLAIVSFGIFFEGSLFIRSDFDPSGSIARVQSGTLKRKSNRGTVFQSAQTDTELFHLDSIWVDSGERAEIKIGTDTFLTLHEKTFLILKRNRNVQNAPVQASLVKGKVEVKRTRSFFKGNNVELEVNDSKVSVTGGSELTLEIRRVGDKAQLEIKSGSPIVMDTGKQIEEKKKTGHPDERQNQDDAPNATPPDQSESESPDSTEEYYPADQTAFYLVSKDQAQVNFTWPGEKSGTLRITNSKGEKVAELQMESEAYARIELKSGETYRWELIDKNQKIIAGPFSFTVKPFSQEAIEQEVQGNQEKKIEIIQ